MQNFVRAFLCFINGDSKYVRTMYCTNYILQVAMNSLVDAAMWDLEIQGKTAVCVAVGGVVRGVLGVADTAKAEAYSTIKALGVLGMDVWMVRTNYYLCAICCVISTNLICNGATILICSFSS